MRRMVLWWVGLLALCCVSFGLSLLVADILGHVAQLCFLPVQFLMGFAYGILTSR